MSAASEKPLHARLAESLGWKNVRFAPEGNASGWGGKNEPVWIGDPPGGRPLVNVDIPPLSESRWLDFADPIPTDSGRTYRWGVWPKGVSRADRLPIGVVGWHAPWRRYALRPRVHAITVFDATCLREIAAFCDWLMAERRAR